MQSALTVVCLRDRSQLDRLEPQWDLLLASSDVASPFLTPGWQAAWLDTYGRGRLLWVLTAHRADRLVGLWPLTLVRRSIFRVLEPAGAGRSDWLDVLTTEVDRGDVVAAFLAYLADRRRDWDLLDCRDILSESPSVCAFEQLDSGAGLRCRRAERSVAPYLTLAGSWQEYLNTKASKSRATLKKKRRLADQQCTNFRIGRHEWRKDDPIVDRLAEVELRSWKARDGNLKISTAVGREFYWGFCGYFAGRKQLDLWRADYDGGLIAYLVNICYGGKCYHYNASFDERYGQVSPGLLLHAEAIQEGFRLQLSEYDFLSGDEPYKDRWCSGKRPIHHLAFYSSNLRSRAAFLALVGARWVFRKSNTLRAARQRLLALSRRLRRRGENQ